MRIVFIHSGKCVFQQLGPHYGPLIKHSLHLLPMHDYLSLQTPKEKNKYRSIESLPAGCLIGVALIDESYWFSVKDLSSPWSHGPYCYHIRDAFRLPSNITCRGYPGLWKIDYAIQIQIESMPCIMNKINEWRNTYKINEKYNIYTALTIMQPFAESIIRKIKDIENRGQKVFKLTDNDGVFEGCRLCINVGKNHGKPVMDYVKYGQQFKIYSQHKNLSKYITQTNFKYHATATVTQCQCGKNKKKENKISNENINNNKSQRKREKRKKRKKLSLEPLHGRIIYNKRKKTVKTVKTVKTSKLKGYDYYEHKKNINDIDVASDYDEEYEL